MTAPAGPFCVYLAHKAIHPNTQQRDDGSRADPTQSDAPEAFIPAERHKHLYEGKTAAAPGKLLAATPRQAGTWSDHPEGMPPLGPTTGTTDAVILARMRTMKAVDESLGSILSALEARRVARQHHRHLHVGPRLLLRRALPRTGAATRVRGNHPHPAARPVPATLPAQKHSVAIRDERRHRTNRPDAGRHHTATSLHGRPLWATPHRDAVLIEYFSDTVFPRIRNMGYQAVRTQRWKYIHYQDIKDADELYDVRKDPFELHNLITDTKAPRKQLQQRLNELLRESGAAT